MKNRSQAFETGDITQYARRWSYELRWYFAVRWMARASCIAMQIHR